MTAASIPQSSRLWCSTFVSAAALLDFEVTWLYSEASDSMLSCTLTPEGLSRRLDGMETLPIAVYVTSPDSEQPSTPHDERYERRAE